MFSASLTEALPPLSSRNPFFRPQGSKNMLRLRQAAVVTALLAAPALAQVQETFQEGIAYLDSGNEAEALKSFKRVLAMNPSHEDAWQLWNSTEHGVWLRLLAEQGEIDRTARAIMALATVGKKDRSDDPDTIRTLINQVASDDALERNQAIRTLAANHGEFAVRYMVFALADQGNDDRRIAIMSGLSRMGGDVVLPLIEALDSPDAYLRRNVAFTLGYIGDPRANAALARVAAGDVDSAAREAAKQALARCGGSTDAVEQYLALGAAYYAEDDSVLAPHAYSDVVWSWEDGKLESADVPRFLYGAELGKRAYYHALALTPDSTEALAGIARTSIAQQGRLDDWAAGGGDVGEWPSRLASDELAVQLAGAQALDTALGWALDQGDQVAASGLCRILGHAAPAATANLSRALAMSSAGAVRGEAAVALASIAQRTHTAAPADAVVALSEAAARKVMRIGAIIDSDRARSDRLARQLGSQGMFVNAYHSGGRGIAGVRSIPHVDVLLVADGLSDLTFAQVVEELKLDPRTQNIPVLAVSSDGDDSVFGDQIEGVVSSGDASAVEAALSGSLGADRQKANQLGARAAAALAALAAGGNTDVSAAADELVSALAHRPEAVTIPALGTLAYIGGPQHTGAIVSVLQESDSDALRLAAAEALAGIFARSGQVDSVLLGQVRDIATSDSSGAVRAAAAGALGHLDLTPAMRVELMRAVRDE